jgi:hypothetical protein
MAENKKNIEDILEKLTLITEAAEELFPDSKQILIFELNNEDFKEIQKNFREIDNNKLRFKIDISGKEIVFINNEIYKTKEEEVIEKKVSFWKRLFFRKGGKPSIKK